MASPQSTIQNTPQMPSSQSFPNMFPLMDMSSLDPTLMYFISATVKSALAPVVTTLNTVQQQQLQQQQLQKQQLQTPIVQKEIATINKRGKEMTDNCRRQMNLIAVCFFFSS